MLISSEFYEQLCPSYKKVVKNLDDNISKLESEATNDAKLLQKELIENFYANYLMPKEYWHFYERLENIVAAESTVYAETNLKTWLNIDFDDLNKSKKQRIKAYKHFYFNRSREPLPQLNASLKLLKFSGGHNDYLSDQTEQTYPHSNLKKCFQIYEMNSACPPPKTLVIQYEKMKELYQKIISSEKNVEEWFKNLCEAGDTDFVIHNVEYRLGGNLLDKTLWKLYIKFLENVDTKKMLQVYSNYCRFFLDDSEMKEEYETKVEKYGPVFVHWDTVFDFEKKAVENDEEKEDSDESPQMDSRNIVPKFQPFDKNVTKTFYQNYQKQVFPFQQPLMEYILENGNSAVWRKLHQTCKHFYVRKLIPICYRLRIQGHTSSFYKEFLELNFTDNENDYLKETWITTTLFCNYDQSLPTDYLSRIIPRLYQCDAKYITIWNQKLSFDELKFLIGSGNVIDLNLLCMRIKDEKNEWINLEKIMEFLPIIEQLQLSNVKFNKNTANLLEKQRFNSKINSLILLDIFGEPFDTTEFLNFTKKNRDEYFFLRMEFKLRQPGFSNEFITAFRNLMEAENDMKNTHIEINFTPM